MLEKPDCEISPHILNSLLALYANAVEPLEIESKVLPEFSKHNIDLDANSYSQLMRLYMTQRDLDKVIDLYRKTEEANIKPIYKIMSYFLEAGMRKEDSALI